jgi:hypothetical protein
MLKRYDGSNFVKTGVAEVTQNRIPVGQGGGEPIAGSELEFKPVTVSSAVRRHLSIAGNDQFMFHSKDIDETADLHCYQYRMSYRF